MNIDYDRQFFAFLCIGRLPDVELEAIWKVIVHQYQDHELLALTF